MNLRDRLKAIADALPEDASITLSVVAQPFEWKFTRRDLDRLVARWAASDTSSNF